MVAPLAYIGFASAHLLPWPHCTPLWRPVLCAQDKRLPLHYAVEKKATSQVVELLLGGESNAVNAVTAAATDKAPALPI